MQRLLLTPAIGIFLLSACANEKFQGHGNYGNASTAAPGNGEAIPDTRDEAPNQTQTVPADVVESIASSEPAQIQKPIFADCQTSPDRPIVADLYQLPTDTKVLPDFSKLKSIKKICLAQLDIKTRRFSDGFPGVEQLFEWFSLDMRFSIKVPKEGKWEFKLVADDGAILSIDQNEVIDNDGVHQTEEKSGRATLSAGLHDVRVSYFQGPRYNIALELYWKGPQDREFSYIPAANLMRPQDLKLSSHE